MITRGLQLRFVLPMVLALLVLTLGAESAQAQVQAVDCKQFAGVTNRIASCVTQTVGNAAEAFFDPNTGFYSLVKLAVTATVTLATIVYGILLAFGMVEKVGRDTVMLGLKVACVTFFCANADYTYSKVTQFMNASAQSVVFFVPTTGEAVVGRGFDQLVCLQKMRLSQTVNGGGAIVGPWVGIDCLIDSVIGIRTDEGQGTSPDPGTEEYYRDNLSATDKGVSRGLLYLFFSTAQTSVVGLMLAIIGMCFVWGLVMLIIQSLFAFLAGYIAATFLIIISPLFIPLVLFRQTKEQYFDKWVKLLMSAVFQPVFMLAFISFSVAAMDLAVYSGDYSIMYRIAGDASRAPGFSLNKYLLDNQIAYKKPSTILQQKGATNSELEATTPDGGGILAGNVKSICTTLFMEKTNPTPDEKKKQDDCKRVASTKIWHNAMNWEKLAQVRIPSVWMEEDGAYCYIGPGSDDAFKAKCAKQMANEVLAATIFCAVVVYVLNGMMKVVPNIIVDLVGDFSQTPNFFSAMGMSKIPGGSQAQSAAKSTSNAIAGLVGRR